MLALPSRLRRAIAALVATLSVVALVAACGWASSVSSSSGSAGVSQQSGLAPASATTDLPTVAVDKLPAEAVTTLTLIAHGGPYPYSRDGVTFQNRERQLPKHPDGWYHEYTVVTPGSSDRGARRIITGKDGGRFYTDDHYASFREVVSGSSS